MYVPSAGGERIVNRMAHIRTHIEDCERLLGRGYAYIHRWLDEYAQKYPPQIHLEYHRHFRHNKKTLDAKFKEWGYYEILAAKIHIIRDCDIFILDKLMDLVELEEVDELYEKAINNYCHSWKEAYNLLKE